MPLDSRPGSVWDLGLSEGRFSVKRFIRKMGRVDPEICAPACTALLAYASETSKPAAEVRTLWDDSNFDADARAVYCVLALEKPICRGSSWHATRAGVTQRPGGDIPLQDRAWSSPIWYGPQSARVEPSGIEPPSNSDRPVRWRSSRLAELNSMVMTDTLSEYRKDIGAALSHRWTQE